MKKSTFLLILLWLSPTFVLFAQQTNILINRQQNLRFEGALYSIDQEFHTSIRPFREAEVREVVSPDSIDRFGYNDGKFANTWVGKRIFKQHAVQLDSSKFQLYADPLFNLEVGRDLVSDTNTYVNTRGLQIGGSIGKKFSFYSSFYENQAKYAPWLTEYIEDNIVVPGQGRIKPFEGGGFDFSMAEGYLSYTPSKYFNIQFGHGKNFIGDGYRSMLLSDFAFNYPYLKLTTSVWKLRYVNLFTSFQDLQTPVAYEAGYPKKYGSFHYLSYNVCKRFSIGLFEGIIWQARDSTGTRGFDFNYLNPIIYFRPVEFSLGSPDNAIIGANFKVLPLDKIAVYGQVAIDDINLKRRDKGSGFFQNKIAFQIGAKAYDPLGIKNLFLQLEYNQARPYTYAHKTPLQNYSHFNEPLAHPLGANFREVVGIFNYRFRDIGVYYKLNYALYGLDMNGDSYGGDISISDFDAVNGHFSFGNEIGQGLRTTLITNDFRLSYLINPTTNMNLFFGVQNRIEKNDLGENKTNLVYFGFRTALRNLYTDF